MKVQELISRLQRLPDRSATVVIAEGANPLAWLVVTGVITRGIKLTGEKPRLCGAGIRTRSRNRLGQKAVVYARAPTKALIAHREA
jgi:hypothetical protein